MAVQRVEKCGTWTLRQEIGRGAAGVVYLATNAEGRFAAVKVCFREELGDVRYERELRGAKLFKQIPSGEGLVRVLEFGDCSWGFFTVMELADDEFGAHPDAIAGYRPKTLSSVIAGEKALSVKESLKLGLALAKGLETLQRHHLLHRDIKPGNVIYVGGRPVLSDPGLIIEESEAVSLVGTPGYVPPERFTAAASDIYSLGLTLKAASFGRQVEELDKGPAMETDTGAVCFPAWWRILNKATDPVASRRYQSAKALLKDLQMLRLRMRFAAKTLGLPRYAWLLMGVLAAVLARSAFRSRLSSEYSESRWKAQDEYVAQEASRVKMEIASSLQEMNNSLLSDASENLANLEQDIAECEQRLADDEKRLLETDWKDDFSSKARLENGIRDEGNYLTNYLLKARASAVERVEELKAKRNAK